MLNKIKSKIREIYKSGFCIRRVICSCAGEGKRVKNNKIDLFNFCLKYGKDITHNSHPYIEKYNGETKYSIKLRGRNYI